MVSLAASVVHGPAAPPLTATVIVRDVSDDEALVLKVKTFNDDPERCKFKATPPPVTSMSDRVKPVTAAEKVAVKGKVRPLTAPASSDKVTVGTGSGLANVCVADASREPTPLTMHVTVGVTSPPSKGMMARDHSVPEPSSATNSPPTTEMESVVSVVEAAVIAEKPRG
jgi:hypothetical protein